jgi:predicted nucleotidyltransferase
VKAPTAAISRLSQALRLRYGSGIVGIRVFGSVARGTDTGRSDIDVLVILGSDVGPVDWRAERAVRDIAMTVELEEDVVFDLIVVAEGDLQGLRGHSPFMERVAREGVSV